MKDQGITINFVLLCETFLSKTNSHLFPISGYNVHVSSTQLTKGGVAIYFLDEYNYKERFDLNIHVEGEFESIVLEIQSKNNKYSENAKSYKALVIMYINNIIIYIP